MEGDRASATTQRELETGSESVARVSSRHHTLQAFENVSFSSIASSKASSVKLTINGLIGTHTTARKEVHFRQKGKPWKNKQKKQHS